MILSTKEIMELVKIDSSFLMIDHAYDIIPGKTSSAIKELNNECWFFQSHLKSENAMPGVLQTEAMLQTVILAIYTIPGQSKITPFIVDTKSHFYKRVGCDSSLIVETEIYFNRRGLIKGKGQCRVKNSIVCVGEFIFAVPQDVPKVKL
jgi:3-hydroxymyristoyl/3-hydroxydecanoyl-(acyl carrier protein) dehydratase